MHGTIGIGHTRWATHGLPTEDNAHPIATDRVAVVHNGIIENFQELKRELTGLGHRFVTQTDTEAVAILTTHHLAQGLTPAQAVARTLARLEGAFALVFLFAGEHDLLDLRPARQPAGDRLWRRRDVYRLGFAGAGAADPARSPISKKATGPS